MGFWLWSGRGYGSVVAGVMEVKWQGLWKWSGRGLNYFFLFLLFFTIIFSVVVIIYFSKWLTLGPKLKRRWKRITRQEKKSEVINGVQVRGGEVVIDANYLEALKISINQAGTPQEKLHYQQLIEKHEIEKSKAEKQIKEQEEIKLEKIRLKQEKKRISKEAKEEAKKIKNKK